LLGAALLERLVGEVPDRLARGRVGAGERVAMLGSVLTPVPHAPYATRTQMCRVVAAGVVVAAHLGVVGDDGARILVLVDRVAAARVLGVDAGASPERVERAFRGLVRRTHPDRFPPGSEAWEDASYAMAELNEARAVMSAPVPPAAPAATEVAADGTRWRWAETATPVEPDFRVDPLAADRRARGWGLSWGAFLLVASAVSLLVGAHGTTNDALPLWAPALALTGVVSLVIGLRAHERLLGRTRR